VREIQQPQQPSASAGVEIEFLEALKSRILIYYGHVMWKQGDNLAKDSAMQPLQMMKMHTRDVHTTLKHGSGWCMVEESVTR